MNSKITPIIMPKWGLSMKEGKLGAWLVEEGATISVGDEIMDVETDKIANAVEAADAGVLRRRVGEEGRTYLVRALLGVMAPADVSDAEVDAYVAAFEAPVAADDDEDAGPSYEYAALPVGRVRYAMRPGDGTPVILIHGFGGDLDNWLFNIDALAGAHPVYALDLPGHGHSVKAVDHPDLAVMVGTISDFMGSLGLDKAHLVGHSMGGLIAAKMAIDHPKKVASVSLICSAGLGGEINAGYIGGFVDANSRKELKQALELLFADPTLVSRAMVDDVLKYKRLDGVQPFLTALSAALFANGKQTVGIAAALKASKVPTLVIWGANDAIIPAAHAKAADGTSVHILSGAGHMVQLEKAGDVNALLKAHFA